MDGGKYSIFKNDNNIHIEEPNSNFNQHRRDIIKYSIENNLSTAISNYNNYTGSTNNFQMPKLKETEWDKILSNVSVVAYMQGLRCGLKIYNNYAIVSSTNNEISVTPSEIYYTPIKKLRYKGF